MKYLLIGLLVSMGWHIARFIIDGVLGEIIYKRLHKTKLYNVLIGNQNFISDKKSTGTKMKIGF